MRRSPLAPRRRARKGARRRGGAPLLPLARRIGQPLRWRTQNRNPMWDLAAGRLISATVRRRGPALMTFRRHLRFVFVLLCVLLVGSVGRTAYADDVADEADLQFQLGAERYEAGDYKGALEHFLTSNRLVPNKNVLFNIARTYEQLKRAPDAYRYYVLALEGETNPQSRKRVEEAL